MAGRLLRRSLTLITLCECGLNSDLVQRGFCGASVPPAVLRLDSIPKIAGGTSAPQNPALQNVAWIHQSSFSKRCEISGLIVVLLSQGIASGRAAIAGTSEGAAAKA